MTTTLTLIEPCIALAPSSPTSVLIGRLARNALCEYRRWYPIVILAGEVVSERCAERADSN